MGFVSLVAVIIVFIYFRKKLDQERTRTKALQDFIAGIYTKMQDGSEDKTQMEGSLIDDYIDDSLMNSSLYESIMLNKGADLESRYADLFMDRSTTNGGSFSRIFQNRIFDIKKSLGVEKELELIIDDNELGTATGPMVDQVIDSHHKQTNSKTTK